MISRRPSIFIYASRPDPDFLREICAGIKEEGVFFEIFRREETDVNVLAHQAAEDSMLGSGIGISGVDVVLQIRGMRVGRNVEARHMPTFEQCRAMGADSARVIKKLGLKAAD